MMNEYSKGCAYVFYRWRSENGLAMGKSVMGGGKIAKNRRKKIQRKKIYKYYIKKKNG